ncbi:GNAT family N-acetyltransferase [[Bacillus] enclensis]|uniref:GNAT family N-acetyltransferase n=1 Tax=[Bacillus] enclensis TaxID=1402860 RepID=UPI003013751D
MIYSQEGNLILRPMNESDIDNFVTAFEEQGWNKPRELFEHYFIEQSNKEREVFVAEKENQPAGYVSLIYSTDTGPYAAEKIPEIGDLNVLEKFQRNGIGNKLMETAEGSAKERCDSVSLAVGLHEGYGPAQKMYIKRGYVPDGSGVWYRGGRLEPYAMCENDDDLTLYLLKVF